MWVYDQPPRNEKAAVLPPQRAAEPEPAARERGAAPQSATPPETRRGGGQEARGRVWLAAAYLLGTAASGALQALCGTGQREALGYYLGRWCALFAPDGARGAAVLFGCEYFAAAAVFTVLLFLGLSAFGPLPIFLFVMLYGTGCGLLVSQLFSGLTPKLLAAYVIVAGVPLALLAGCVCVFGAAAMRVCTRLHALSFGRRADTLAGIGARGLAGQYVLFVVSLAPVCGAAAGLAYMAERLKIW